MDLCLLLISQHCMSMERPKWEKLLERLEAQGLPWMCRAMASPPVSKIPAKCKPSPSLQLTLSS